MNENFFEFNDSKPFSVKFLPMNININKFYCDKNQIDDQFDFKQYGIELGVKQQYAIPVYNYKSGKIETLLCTENLKSKITDHVVSFKKDKIKWYTKVYNFLKKFVYKIFNKNYIENKDCVVYLDKNRRGYVKRT